MARISTIQPVQRVVLPFEDSVAAGADLLQLRHILHALQVGIMITAMINIYHT